MNSIPSEEIDVTQSDADFESAIEKYTHILDSLHSELDSLD